MQKILRPCNFFNNGLIFRDIEFVYNTADKSVCIRDIQDDNLEVISDECSESVIQKLKIIGVDFVENIRYSGKLIEVHTIKVCSYKVGIYPCFLRVRIDRVVSDNVYRYQCFAMLFITGYKLWGTDFNYPNGIEVELCANGTDIHISIPFKMVLHILNLVIENDFDALVRAFNGYITLNLSKIFRNMFSMENADIIFEGWNFYD